jgi:hypothetical protein
MVFPITQGFLTIKQEQLKPEIVTLGWSFQGGESEVRLRTTAGPSTTIGARHAPISAQDDKLFLMRTLDSRY